MILDAGLQILSEQGASDLTFPQVSRLAGLSMRPVRDRFADRGELAAAIWAERIYPLLHQDLLAVQEACEVVIKAGAQETDSLISALAPFTRPEPRMRAALEMLVVSGFDPIVRGALDSTLIPALRTWLTPGPDGLTRGDAARRALTASYALGIAACALQLRSPSVILDGEMNLLASALATEREPQIQPNTPADHLDGAVDFGTGEPDLDNLLQVTLDQVGVRGYDGATTTSIARASRHTEGFLFSRYPTKLDLFFDATRRLIGSNAAANIAYQEGIAKSHSPGMAEAVFMREFMRPGRERLRVIALEQFRVSWADERFRNMVNAGFEPFLQAIQATHSAAGLQASQARAFIEFVRGCGPIFLSQLLPETWDLPYDVVTIPLLDTTP